MPRYEMVEGTSSKFWEIELSGASFTTTYGRIGTDGQSTTKEWKNEAEAKKQYDKLIAEKTKKGYELVAGDGDDEDDSDDDDSGDEGVTNADLEKAILANPDAPDAYAVYGDWLQGKGDALGELIAVQVAIAAGSTPALVTKEKSLLDAHRDEWLGEALTELESDELTVTWRYGFLDKVALGGEEYSENSAVAAYNALAGRRVAKFLRDLELNVFEDDDGQPSYAETLEAMKVKKLPPTLRRLAFDVKSYQISWTSLGDLSALYPQLQNLEELRIAVGDSTLGTINLPKLKKFEYITGGLRDAQLKSIVEAKWPLLETLVIYFGDTNYGAMENPLEALEPLLSGKGIPKVKHLGLCNAQQQEQILRAVLDSKVLAQLSTLDLSKGTLGDESAELLISAKKKWAHLAKLIVSENYFSSDMQTRLRQEFGDRIDANNQNDPADPDDRYVSISE